MGLDDEGYLRSRGWEQCTCGKCRNWYDPAGVDEESGAHELDEAARIQRARDAGEPAPAGVECGPGLSDPLVAMFADVADGGAWQRRWRSRWM